MQRIQTNCQRKLNHTPTKLEILREINTRTGLRRHQKLKEEYKRLEKGFEGEEELVKYLKEYGNGNWIIIQNVWLEYFGEFEIDVLLITKAGLYAFEVKNYSGKLELQNNQCLMNGHLIGHNPFAQAQKSTIHLKQIFKNQLHGHELQGVLTFIGEHNRVQVYDNLSGIEVLCRNELMHYIKQIIQRERSYLGYPLDVEAVLSAVQPYEIGKPSKEKEIPQTVKTSIQKGIYCCHCGSFALETRNIYIVCRCGMHESKEEAIVRTICEYGLIHHEENLTTTALTEFFNGFITSRTVRRYLNKHFERIGTHKNTEFMNKKLPFKEVASEFELPSGKYFKIK